MTFVTTTTTTPTTLRAAYQQARARYQANPTDPAAVRAMGWTLANLLKNVSGDPHARPDRILKGLAMLIDFPMVSEDLRWRESVLWSVNRFLLRAKPEQLSLVELAQLVRQSQVFLPQEPSLARSVWWKALLRHSATGVDWLGLFAELGFKGTFRPEDETAETYGEGKTATPLVEGLLGVVTKQLLQQIPLTDEQAQPWLDQLTRMTDHHPDWQYVAWYHAKLLLRLDRRSEAMRVFLPFARRKRNDFWMWGMLVDLLPETAVDQQLACFGRALSQKTAEPFLVKIRQRLAALLIQQNRWNDARFEIDRLIETRQRENWSIPGEVMQWMNDDHYTQAEFIPADWYSVGDNLAEATLFADMPVEVVLVTGFDPAGIYCNFVRDGQTTGSFPCRRFGLTLSAGDRLAIRYELRSRNGRPQIHVLTTTVTLDPCTHVQTRTVSGVLRKVPNRTIAFVDNVYVPTDVLAAASETADESVTVEAVSAWDKGKEKMGWRAVRLVTIS